MFPICKQKRDIIIAPTNGSVQGSFVNGRPNSTTDILMAKEGEETVYKGDSLLNPAYLYIAFTPTSERDTLLVYQRAHKYLTLEAETQHTLSAMEHCFDNHLINVTESDSLLIVSSDDMNNQNNLFPSMYVKFNYSITNTSNNKAYDNKS